jgi:hypothetical protein
MRDREKYNAYMREWNSRHKNQIHDSQKRWRDKNHVKYTRDKVNKCRQRQLWLNQQKSKPCMDCHTQYPPYVMQYDHRDPLQKRDGIGANHGINWMKEEIQKCDLVCANCHAIRTYKTRKYISKYLPPIR